MRGGNPLGSNLALQQRTRAGGGRQHGGRGRLPVHIPSLHSVARDVARGAGDEPLGRRRALLLGVPDQGREVPGGGRPGASVLRSAAAGTPDIRRTPPPDGLRHLGRDEGEVPGGNTS